MQKRNIALAIILSLVTCGIYWIYWFIVLTNEINMLARPKNQTSGGAAFLLSCITCGIYGLYWAYRMGENLDTVTAQQGQITQSRAAVYLILQLFLPIVAIALMQSTVNDLLDSNY